MVEPPSPTGDLPPPTVESVDDSSLLDDAIGGGLAMMQDLW